MRKQTEPACYRHHLWHSASISPSSKNVEQKKFPHNFTRVEYLVLCRWDDAVSLLHFGLMKQSILLKFSLWLPVVTHEGSAHHTSTHSSPFSPNRKHRFCLKTTHNMTSLYTLFTDLCRSETLLFFLQACRMK